MDALERYSGELLPENRYDDWTLERREELEQLRAELAAELPSLGPAPRAPTLPPQASSFVGRGHELRELTALLRGTRLLTLAGAGGAGKTRLALELARRSEGLYADGAALVELASVGDGELVPSAVAAALDLGPLPGRSQLDAIVDHLAPRGLLLVLDNCEHLLSAAAALCEALLRAAPDVTILATTPRAASRRRGGRLPRPLAGDPRPRAGPRAGGAAALRGGPPVRRPAAPRPFRVSRSTPSNAQDVARICFRLDGLPLALELAAARLEALGTGTLAERLDDRFTLLRAGGARGADAPADARSRRCSGATICCSRRSRSCFAVSPCSQADSSSRRPRRSAPAGPLEREAVVDVLARLVEKSLVTIDPGCATGRTRAPLSAAGDRAAVRARAAGRRRRTPGGRRQRHARWALALAEREGERPTLDREAANLRAAHACSRPPRSCATSSPCFPSGCGGSTSRRLTGVCATPSRPHRSERSCARRR